jgi:ketosteroid isomerase-like protein
MNDQQMTNVERETSAVVDRLYQAYFAGDADGMLDTMSEDVWVRFLGIIDLHGIEGARKFFRANNAKLLDLDFQIRTLIIDGHHAAAVWEESARTAEGEPYANHGVDVFEVRDGRIVSLHENNDVRVHRRHFGRR